MTQNLSTPNTKGTGEEVTTYHSISVLQHYGHFADYRSVENRRNFFAFFAFVSCYTLAIAALYYLNSSGASGTLLYAGLSFTLALFSSFILAIASIQFLEYTKVIRHGTAITFLPIIMLCTSVLVLGLVFVAGVSATKFVFPLSIYVLFFSLAALISSECRRYRTAGVYTLVFWVFFLLRVGALVLFCKHFIERPLLLQNLASEFSSAEISLLVGGGVAFVINLVILSLKNKLVNNPLLPPVEEEKAKAERGRRNNKAASVRKIKRS